MRYQGWMAAHLQAHHPEDARGILFNDQVPAAQEEAIGRLQECHRRILSQTGAFLVVTFALSDQSPLPRIVERAQVPAAHLDLDGPGLRLPDGHPNPRGHAHFAAQIAARIHEP